jgi:HSP20 family molecular chaperone IbpA
MSQITVHRPEKAEFGHKLKGLFQRVRERAYAHFEERKCTHGRALDDWLQAEQECLLKPEVTIEERDHEVRLTANMSDFKPEEIHIDAEPNSILVTAEHNDKSDGELVTCVAEFELLGNIDVDHIKAKLQHGGVLEITAKKPQHHAQAAA